MSVVSQHRAGEGVKKTAPQDTPARSRLIIGENGPSDSALAASSGRRLIAAQPLTGTLRAALLGPCARAAPLGAIRPRRLDGGRASHSVLVSLCLRDESGEGESNLPQGWFCFLTRTFSPCEEDVFKQELLADGKG